MEVVKSFGKNSIKAIFEDHWEGYLEKHKNNILDYQVKEVEKMLSCRDPKKLGYHKYSCPDHPGEYVIIPHSCKSRFCSVCGTIQTNKWMHEAMNYFPDCGYFHLVFTIPDYLWYFFKSSDKHLLSLLFESANEAVLGWFNDRGITPAAIAVLHTFGKKVNYNTHIHMIVSAGGLKKLKVKKKRFDTRTKAGRRKIEEMEKEEERLKIAKEKNSPEDYVWKDIAKLPWGIFRKRWKAILLKKLDKYIDYHLEDIVSKKQWYFYMAKALDNPIFTCNYIGRYSKRPPMAETRITKYDGNFVTFYYEEVQNGGWKKKEYITLGWEEFIERLIQHIPPSNFRMVRQYGILSNAKRGKLLNIVFTLLNQEIKKQPEWPSWRMRQKEYLNRDPLLCKVCGREMVLSELAFWSKRNDEIYIKHMNLELAFENQPREYYIQNAFFEKFFSIFNVFKSQIYLY